MDHQLLIIFRNWVIPIKFIYTSKVEGGVKEQVIKTPWKNVIKEAKQDWEALFIILNQI